MRATGTDTDAIFLSAVSYLKGKSTPISDLTDGNLSSGAITMLAEQGIHQYYKRKSTAEEMYAATIARTTKAAGLKVDDLRGISFAQPTVEWDQSEEASLMTALESVGFKAGPVVGTSLQGCSALAGAIMGASQLIQLSGGPILLLLGGIKGPNGVRYSPELSAIFSDGVASAIISRGSGDFRILAISTRTSIRLATNLTAGSRNLSHTCELVSETISKAMSAAGIAPDDVNMLSSNNTSKIALEFLSAASGIPAQRIWPFDVGHLGHFYSCDTLINLDQAHQSGRLAVGDIVVLAGWSPYTVSAVVMRMDKGPQSQRPGI